MNIPKNDPRTWVEVDLERIKNNFQELNRKIDEKTFFGAVVKSNAYGHGIIEVSRALDEAGADWFMVDGVQESEHLRTKGIKKPVLVLGFTPPNLFEKAKKYRSSITISGWENIEALKSQSPEGLKVQLMVNTGMNRQGVFPGKAEKAIREIKESPAKLEGIYSHLAEAGTPDFKKTKRQIEKFKKTIQKTGLKESDLVKHCAATAGTLAYPESVMDMARIGIGLYGLWPSKAVRKKYHQDVDLQPALTWKSILSEVKKVSEAEEFGYGFSEKVEKDTQIGIVPVGYWHGYPFQASRKGEVFINGARAKVLGRVSMDMLIVDLSGVEDPEPGEEVELVGENIPARELGKKAKTINYDIVSSINPTIERVYKS